MDPPSQCWASHVNTILVQTLIAKIFSTKASTNTLELSRIVLSRKNLTSSQSSSDNVAKPSISKLEIPFRAHYRTKWRHFVFDRPFGRARADKMPICLFKIQREANLSKIRATIEDETGENTVRVFQEIGPLECRVELSDSQHEQSYRKRLQHGYATLSMSSSSKIIPKCQHPRAKEIRLK